MKNLVASDFTETKDELRDQRFLLGKCANMLVELKDVRTNIFSHLVSCTLHGHLDYQWTNAGSELLTNFVEVVRAVKKHEVWRRYSNDDDESKEAHEESKLELKSAVIAHHRTMLHLIKEAPRKYGRGVNQELVTFLSKEVDALCKQNVTLDKLDGIEMADLENSRGNMGSSSDKEFWQMKIQMHDKFLELRKMALDEERKSGKRHDD